MIFAAGIGSRLKPWTDSHPKALVPVGGVPMLVRVIEKLADFGVSRIVVNVHHFASQIVDVLTSYDAPVDVLISDESDRLLDTGGGLAKALPLIGDEEVLIHNADILGTVNLDEMLKFHHLTGADATLMTDPREASRRLVLNSEFRLKGWINTSNGELRPPELSIANSDSLRSFDGVHIVSPSLYDALRSFAADDAKFSIIDFYIKNCRSKRIMGYDIPPDATWFDVGKPETLEKARDFVGSVKNVS